MEIRFLEDYKGYKRGDIVTSVSDLPDYRELARAGIVKVNKQKKNYPDKMMRTSTNK